MASTTSIPFVTRPNAANLPSRYEAAVTRIKKFVVAVFASSPRAIETTPRSWSILFGSSGIVRWARHPRSLGTPPSRVQILPPWMTKPGTTRLNVVVSNAPVAVRLRKLRTDSGALSGYISISISPASVSILTHLDASVLTSALSNGSGAAGGGAAGRALALGGSGDGVGDWENAAETAAAMTINTKM